MSEVTSSPTGTPAPSEPPMAGPQLALLAGLLALPLLGLAVLLARPSADVHWQHRPAHFWLVLTAAVLTSALAYATGVAARRRGDRRVHLVSLVFLSASGFLALHALATPGVLLDRPNLGFVIATPIGLVVAGAFAALSALDAGPRPALLQNLLLAVLAAWLVVSLAVLPDLEDAAVPERVSPPLVVLSVVGVGLFAFAVGRYALLFRRRRSTLLLAFAIAFVLLAEALVAVAVSRNWQVSWWEWHALMLVAFGLIAWAAHREWHEERFSALYGDETAGATRTISVLFADLKGFTAFSERNDAGVVSEMLNAQFAAAIPAIERHGGEIDRLMGDAVFAIFDGDGHAERAARSALALQEETGAVAAAQPGWPRFRAGVNTGPASVGVLGRGSGRTYSAIGDTVNIGSRIEGLAPVGGVAISAETARGLSGATTRPLGVVEVKGRAEPVAVLLLIALPPPP
jgi:class 3 adenylate cyclase